MPSWKAAGWIGLIALVVVLAAEYFQVRTKVQEFLAKRGVK